MDGANFQDFGMKNKSRLYFFEKIGIRSGIHFRKKWYKARVRC